MQSKKIASLSAASTKNGFQVSFFIFYRYSTDVLLSCPQPRRWEKFAQLFGSSLLGGDSVPWVTIAKRSLIVILSSY